MPTYVPGRCKLCEAEPCPQFDAVPCYPEPPADLVYAAMRDVPAVMADRPPIGEHRRVEATSSHVAGQLKQRGHAVAAGFWAIHRLVKQGHLSLHKGMEQLIDPSLVAQLEWCVVRAEPTLWRLWQVAETLASESTASQLREQHAPQERVGGLSDEDREILAVVALRNDPGRPYKEYAARAGINRTAFYDAARFPVFWAAAAALRPGCSTARMKEPTAAAKLARSGASGDSSRDNLRDF